MKTLTLLLVLLLCTTSCADDSQARAFLGKDFAKVIDNHTSAKVYRLASRIQKPGSTLATVDKDAKKIGEYVITSKAVIATNEQSKALSSLILNDDNYIFGIDKNCLFDPGVALEMSDGQNTIFVLLCFSCRQWGFYMNGHKIKVEDFDPATEKIKIWVKKIFPNDSVIQSL